MRGAKTLIPARFLSLVGHICVLITLLWESERSVSLCLPSQYHNSYLMVYKSRLVAGFGSSLAFALIELLTFIFGLTMFSSTVTLISIGGHSIGTIVLTYFTLDNWLCDWYWPIYVFCSIVPFTIDSATALYVLFFSKR